MASVSRRVISFFSISKDKWLQRELVHYGRSSTDLISQTDIRNTPLQTIIIPLSLTLRNNKVTVPRGKKLFYRSTLDIKRVRGNVRNLLAISATKKIKQCLDRKLENFIEQLSTKKYMEVGKKLQGGF